MRGRPTVFEGGALNGASQGGHPFLGFGLFGKPVSPGKKGWVSFLFPGKKPPRGTGGFFLFRTRSFPRKKRVPKEVPWFFPRKKKAPPGKGDPRIDWPAPVYRRGFLGASLPWKWISQRPWKFPLIISPGWVKIPPGFPKIFPKGYFRNGVKLGSREKP